ncbi:D-serine dehydratase [Stella humosa]|uniref:D-serine dehydratase n=1 Tax=Stella humosa TaxID=94 RepID=A0A3N1M790_9PROT|nr:amino acid deaminase [Stella humosa]ROP99520.1 D-serine dehydratase [Stella humosa]
MTAAASALIPPLGDPAAFVLDETVKGMPPGVAPFPIGAIGEKGWNLLAEDLPLPLAVLKRSALDHNLDWMARFVGDAGAVLAPHGKTTMAPGLFREQVEHGAWAITVGTIHQAIVARRNGVRRVLLANQLIGRQAVRGALDMLRQDPGFELLALVDSVASVELLAKAAAADPIGRPLPLLLEMGYAGGRTGCRNAETALAVARAVKAAEPYLELRGVEGFEGLVAGKTIEECADQVHAFLRRMVAMAAATEAGGLFADGPIILSAGGSAFYDIVVDRFRRAGLHREVLLVSRSGCYVSHDSLMYRDFFAAVRGRAPLVDRLGPGLRPAMEVWAYVQSRPEPGKVILTMGQRDVGVTGGLPQAQSWYRPGADGAPGELGPEHAVTGLNDQHCHMTVPVGSPLQVGDLVGFGVSHPCVTFDKWQVLPVVDDAYQVVGAYRTFF